MLAAIGVEPESKKITFVTDRPQEIPQDSVLIDWQKYIAARQKNPF